MRAQWRWWWWWWCARDADARGIYMTIFRKDTRFSAMAESNSHSHIFTAHSVLFTCGSRARITQRNSKSQSRNNHIRNMHVYMTENTVFRMFDGGCTRIAITYHHLRSRTQLTEMHIFILLLITIDFIAALSHQSTVLWAVSSHSYTNDSRTHTQNPLSHIPVFRLFLSIHFAVNLFHILESECIIYPAI